MELETAKKRIIRYSMSCGGTKEYAEKYAEDLLEKYSENTVSLVARYKDDYGKEDNFLIGNFICNMDAGSWIKFESDHFVKDFIETAFNQGRIDVDRCFGDAEYAKKLATKRLEYVILDSKDPFYSSVWKMVPEDVADKCCESVKKRIKKGL